MAWTVLGRRTAVGLQTPDGRWMAVQLLPEPLLCTDRGCMPLDFWEAMAMAERATDFSSCRYIAGKVEERGGEWYAEGHYAC